MELRERILETVQAAGFDLVGCLPLEEAGDERIREWLAQGHHGSMRWMERHAAAKADPAAAFPHHRSVVVAALEYGEVAPPSPDPLVGNISRYALGDDYHEVLKSRLLDAAARLRETMPELHARAFVDTGPLNEKLVAARAGLGFAGKNTNLINTRRGSYLFLGLLLVDVRLEATGPEEPDRCGLCDACIPACPTGAIVSPYVLDARRCISYLTIEHRGAIPRELRPRIGSRIFGCDDCQEVCPWNRFARRQPSPPFVPRDGLRTRELEAWLALDEDAWRRTFAGSAVMRAGYEGFLRNVIVAAGCSRSRELVPALSRHLRDSSALARAHAAWALGWIGGDDAHAALEKRDAKESDATVREEIDHALGQIDSPKKNRIDI